MKKFACLFLAIVMTVTMLSGCAGQEAKPTAQPAPQSSPAQTAEKENVLIGLTQLYTRLPVRGAAERSEAEGCTPPTSLTLGHLP